MERRSLADLFVHSRRVDARQLLDVDNHLTVPYPHVNALTTPVPQPVQKWPGHSPHVHLAQQHGAALQQPSPGRYFLVDGFWSRYPFAARVAIRLDAVLLCRPSAWAISVMPNSGQPESNRFRISTARCTEPTSFRPLDSGIRTLWASPSDGASSSVGRERQRGHICRRCSTTAPPSQHEETS